MCDNNIIVVVIYSCFVMILLIISAVCMKAVWTEASSRGARSFCSEVHAAKFTDSEVISVEFIAAEPCYPRK